MTRLATSLMEGQGGPLFLILLTFYTLCTRGICYTKRVAIDVLIVTMNAIDDLHRTSKLCWPFEGMYT